MLGGGAWAGEPGVVAVRGKASDWGLRPQVGPPVHLSDRAVVATKGGVDTEMYSPQFRAQEKHLEGSRGGGAPSWSCQCSGR